MIIKNDLFGIAKRLKRLNKAYFIVFNVKKRAFELHNRDLKPSFALNLGTSLDSRTIERVRKSEVKNLDKLFLKLEEDNEKIKLASLSEMKERIMYDVKAELNAL